MAKLYKVTTIDERTRITRGGAIEKIYRVSAETTTGTAFSVEIPEAEFNKEKVDQVLTDKTAQIDEIRNL